MQRVGSGTGWLSSLHGRSISASASSAYSDQSAARFRLPSRWAIIPIPLYPPCHPQKAHGFGASICPAFIHFVSLLGRRLLFPRHGVICQLMRCSVSRFGALFSASTVVDACVILSLVIPSRDFFVFRVVLICNGLLHSFFLCHKFLYFFCPVA